MQALARLHLRTISSIEGISASHTQSRHISPEGLPFKSHKTGNLDYATKPIGWFQAPLTHQ